MYVVVEGLLTMLAVIYWPIVVTDSGITTFTNLVPSLKAYPSISVTELGRIISSNSLVPLNALYAILVTVAGTSNFFPLLIGGYFTKIVLSLLYKTPSSTV